MSIDNIKIKLKIYQMRYLFMLIQIFEQIHEIKCDFQKKDLLNIFCLSKD